MSLNFNPRLLLLALVAIATIGVGNLALTGTAQAQPGPNDPDCQRTQSCNDDDRDRDDDDEDCYGIKCNNRIPDPDPQCEGPNCIPAPCLTVYCPPGDDPGDTGMYETCEDRLPDMAGIYPAQIRRIGPDDAVMIATICASADLRDQQQGVEDIRGVIASNARMVSALKQFGFLPSNVIALKVGRSDAVLYVYKR